MDHFAFGPMCRVHPDTKIKNRDQLFDAMAKAAYETATHVRAATGQTPPTVDLETRLVTLNRTVHIRTKLALKKLDGMVKVSIPDSESNKWGTLDRAMKCFLN